MLGHTIRRIRELREISITELAQKVGIDPSHVSKIETEKRTPTFKTLQLIAIALHISTGVLVLLSETSNEDGNYSSYNAIHVDNLAILANDLLLHESIGGLLLDADAE